jgi:SAM-dependent methyltransferase
MQSTCDVSESASVRPNEDFSTRSKVRDVGRWYITRFVESVARSLPQGASILDAGAGECVYKRFFAHCNYKAIDLAIGQSRWNYGNLDYIAPLHQMPISSQTFDAVLCTQVLEHVEWPRESVSEMFRVLKPGGSLYMTLPMAQGEHQVPYDFFRYTSYGIRSICQGAGFQQVSVTPFGGFPTRVAYELPMMMTLFPSMKVDGKLSAKGVALLPAKVLALATIRTLQVFLFWIDKYDHRRTYPLGWSVIANK